MSLIIRRDLSFAPLLPQKRGLALRDILGKAATILVAALAFWPAFTFAQQAAPHTAANECARPAAGSIVNEPEDLRSRDGVLKVELAYRNFPLPDGREEYCYVSSTGAQAPTLRLKPGDLLVLRLKNELTGPSASMDMPGSSAHISPAHGPSSGNAAPAAGGATTAARHLTNPCASDSMTSLSTNLHFHGLTVPPACHEDDVLNTMIEPGSAAFEYRFRIPADTPYGLYWYHPHVHGYTNPQLLGGASGALIIEGSERQNHQLAGLPERVFVIRDQDLANPNAQSVQSGNVPAPIVLRDSEGDILNTGTGGGKPAKDLSINFVPVPFPQYPPGQIRVRPSERELWRVLNASAITYLDLQVLFGDVPQLVGVVSLDGIPMNENGATGTGILWQSHILLPPAGRAEFIFEGVPQGTLASFVTRAVDTGPAGENDPTRPLAVITSSASAPEPASRLSATPEARSPPASAWLGDVAPVRTRKLYFSERPRDPADPKSPTIFMLTVEGQPEVPYDMNSRVPNITVQQGDVEDWVIENRTRELHAFHIHQTHFILTEWNGVPLDEPFLRDTINVAYWDGRSPQYPSVKLRMDFRDPNIVGTFVYHCHLLEHEDGGMMGTIRVVPRSPSTGRAGTTSHAH